MVWPALRRGVAADSPYHDICLRKSSAAGGLRHGGVFSYRVCNYPPPAIGPPRPLALTYSFIVSDLPVTTTLLLNSLKDQRDDAAWSEFDARYRRVIEDFARSAGLRDDDAAEVAQQTLFDFVKSYRLGRYSRERGRLHSWIIGIAQNKVADCFRAKPRSARGGDASSIGDVGSSTSGGGGHVDEGEASFDLSDSEQVTRVFDEHLRHAIFTKALDRLRIESQMDEATIRAFELVSIRGVTVEAAARECGMKPSEVYVAKHRVLTKLRSMVEDITRAWEA